MTIVELGKKLNEMYNTTGTNKTTMIHLFGILYADDMKEANATSLDIIKAANMQESYQTEVSKGVRLSKYVQLKDSYQNKF